MVKLATEIAVYVPSAFTPNGDALNDNLKPIIFGIKKLIYFKIYNRWGELMYETQTNKQGWDGSYKGVKQSTQSLVWIVEALAADGKVYKQNGTSVLIR